VISSDSDSNSTFSLSLFGSASKLNQVITFGPLPNKTIIDDSFNLSATSTSNLPIVYSSSDESIAAIEGNKVIIKNSGEVLISASQSGNDAYNAAVTVSQKLKITLVTGIEPTVSISFYPNPVLESLTIDFDHPGKHYVQVLDMMGKKWASVEVNDITTRLDVVSLAAGFYLVQVREENGTIGQHKIVKR
jgi:hypothetical protein